MMGVHLSINIDGWDEFSNAGMKEIFRDDDAFPKDYISSDDSDECEFRPLDFDVWRKSIIRLGFNVDMWLMGLAALEADSTISILASY